MSMTIKFFLLLLVVALTLVALAMCAPLKTINAITPSGTYRRTVNVAYGTDPRNKLDVYSPINGKSAAPVVVFFYGGSWNSGNRGDYEFIGEALASRGIVAVLADYRLYPQVRYPSFLQDAAQAVAWSAREVQHYGGDQKRLFVMGHSAGAYNAAMLALDGRWLAAQGLTANVLRGWIGIAGPYDFIPVVNPAVRPVFFYPDTPVDSQPINHVTADAPPALLLAPQVDDMVNPVRNTGGLSNKLRKAGIPVVEAYFEHTSHMNLIATIAGPLRRLAPVLDMTEQFVMSDGERIIRPTSNGK